MFQKHTTTIKTGDLYERREKKTYYRIYEIDNGRYIDPGKYAPYLEWVGTPEEINCDPVELSTDQKWEQVRQQRNLLLSQCDWTQLSDVPLTNDQVIAWRTYRQSLRDIPGQSDPDNLAWPTIPGV